MCYEWKIYILGHPQTPGIYVARQSWAMYNILLGEVKPSCIYQNSLQCFHHLPSVGPKQLCALAHLGCTRKAGIFYYVRIMAKKSVTSNIFFINDNILIIIFERKNWQCLRIVIHGRFQLSCLNHDRQNSKLQLLFILMATSDVWSINYRML